MICFSEEYIDNEQCGKVIIESEKDHTRFLHRALKDQDHLWLSEVLLGWFKKWQQSEGKCDLVY